MLIKKLRLTNFRNFKSKLLDFSDQTTVIIGPNASGKSNILEALFMLSLGRSFKAKVEEETINYATDLARIKGRVEAEGKNFDLEAVLTRGLIDIGAQRPERVAKKKLLVNGVPKRLIDFAGNFKVTLFGPWDLELISESPAIRRKFLDVVLSQVDREYRRALLSYEKGLRQRNRLLFRIREEGLSRSQLLFWDRLLIKNGDYLSEKRADFIDFINATESVNKQSFAIEYDRSAISEGRLEQYAQEEVAAATTLVGPHRDDFCFYALNKKKDRRDLAKYGSRGEQRMGILWLKLAELSFVENQTGVRPTLLLDDIFSELDHPHREVVAKAIVKQQTIITTADPHYVQGLIKVDKIVLDK